MSTHGKMRTGRWSILALLYGRNTYSCTQAQIHAINLLNLGSRTPSLLGRQLINKETCVLVIDFVVKRVL